MFIDGYKKLSFMNNHISSVWLVEVGVVWILVVGLIELVGWVWIRVRVRIRVRILVRILVNVRVLCF